MDQLEFEEQAQVGECPTCAVQRNAIQVYITPADFNLTRQQAEKIAKGIREVQDRGKQL